MIAFLNLDFWTFVLVIAGIYTILAFGVQLQYGYAGLLNFGPAGSMLLGAYTMAILVVRVHVNLWFAALIGIGIAALVGAFTAIPTIRLRAIFLAIATIGISEILRYLATNLQGLTGGPLGTPNLLGPTSTAEYNQAWVVVLQDVQSFCGNYLGLAITTDMATAILIWLVVVLLIVVLGVMVRSPWGRALKAIREDEDAASALGKNALWYRIQAFTIGSALGGLAGVFLGLELTAFSPDDFLPTITIYAYLIVLIAGIGRMTTVPIGAIIFSIIYSGAVFITFGPFARLTDVQDAYVRLILVGSLLILVMAFRPQGIFGRKEELTL